MKALLLTTMIMRSSPGGMALILVGNHLIVYAKPNTARIFCRR
jgi:hypothetical protein